MVILHAVARNNSFSIEERQYKVVFSILPVGCSSVTVYVKFTTFSSKAEVWDTIDDGS
jgi:hypothetical protein